MASVTLAESAKLAQDDLIAGVIESIVTVNRMFEVLPFDGIVGNALRYNREGALGDTQFLDVGSTITAKNPATFVEVTAALTTIAGDAEVNGLIQATRSSDGNDQTQTQIASKAKTAGRNYQNTLINGDGTANTFQGLLALVAASQTVAATAPNGDQLSFVKMDETMDLVLDKDGPSTKWSSCLPARRFPHTAAFRSSPTTTSRSTRPRARPPTQPPCSRAPSTRVVASRVSLV
jgi:hypothetical protein